MYLVMRAHFLTTKALHEPSAVKDVAFDDFRSYEHFHLSDIGPLTVLVGPNAVGKTNVVEGIQLLTAQTSFRNPTGVQLVRDGADFARLHATGRRREQVAGAGPDD